jgi:DNA polymerase I
MKEAVVVLDDALQEHGFIPGQDYAFVLNVHDEWQIETVASHATFIGEQMVQAITQAGINLGIKCPLTGEYKIGTNWAETH